MHCRPCRPFADISLESTRNLAPEHAAHTPRAAHGELTARAQHTPFLDETPFKPDQGSHLCSICEAHILMRKYRSPFSRENGRLAQRERRCLTSTRSQVQNPVPATIELSQVRQVFCLTCFLFRIKFATHLATPSATQQSFRVMNAVFDGLIKRMRGHPAADCIGGTPQQGKGAPAEGRRQHQATAPRTKNKTRTTLKDHPGFPLFKPD